MAYPQLITLTKPDALALHRKYLAFILELHTAPTLQVLLEFRIANMHRIGTQKRKENMEVDNINPSPEIDCISVRPYLP